MKKNILILIFIISAIGNAQVGINVTPIGNELAPVVIDNKNTIKSIRLKEPSETVIPGSVLVSDYEGKASWRSSEILKMPTINSTFGTPVTIDRTVPLAKNQSSPYYVSNTKITLAPGKWAVVINVKAEVVLIDEINNVMTERPMRRSQTVWVRTTLADPNTLDINGMNSWRSADMYLSNLASGEIIGVDTEVTAKGEIYINNQSNTDKVYTLLFHIEFPVDVDYSNTSPKKGYRIKNFGAGASLNGIDRMYAIKLSE